MPQLDAAYNFARYLSRDADAAQDIVQDAFLRAYRGFHGYQGPSARPWLFAIVRNCYHEWLIRRGRRTQIELAVDDPESLRDLSVEDFPSGEDSPETALVRKSEANTVARVINELPRPFREVLVLRELEGLSYGQIAEVVMLPIGTVMSRLARARKKFAEAWRQPGAGKILRAPSSVEISKSGATWVCEMTRGEIDLQQSDDMDFLAVSDETLEEAACGGLM